MSNTKEDNILFIKNYGLFWRRDYVWWGTGRQGNAGRFWGKGTDDIEPAEISIRNQMGLYVLYNICGNRSILDTRDVGRGSVRKGYCDPYGNNDELVYCGFSGREPEQERALFHRIKQHQQPHRSLYGKWNQFSWFGIGELDDANGFPQGDIVDERIRPYFLEQMEAVMIATSRPTNNQMVGDFLDAVKYKQVRDTDRLDR